MRAPGEQMLLTNFQTKTSGQGEIDIQRLCAAQGEHQDSEPLQLAQWLLIDVRRELIKTVVVTNHEVSAQFAAAESSEQVEGKMKQVLPFPVDLL